MTHSEFDIEPRQFAQQAAEPLLPIEKKLIGWSFGLGVVLLVVLALVNHLFPAA
jgi:hypothetical protein